MTVGLIIRVFGGVHLVVEYRGFLVDHLARNRDYVVLDKLLTDVLNIYGRCQVDNKLIGSCVTYVFWDQLYRRIWSSVVP